MEMEISQVIEELRRSGVHVSRRDLLRYAGLGSVAVASASLLAACGGGSETATSAAGGSNATSAASSGGSGSTPSASGATPASGGAASTASTGSGGTPQKGGIWRMAIQSDPVPYPVTFPNALPDILVSKTMYNNLTRYQLKDNVIQVVPDLAESWEANEEVTEYTFKLKSGVKWHDGEPVTADDVKFTYDTELDPKVNVWSRGPISSIKEVQVVDDLTVKFVLSSPYAPLPVMLGYNRCIVPKHLLEGKDPNQPADFLKNPVGTGPFKFKQASPGTFLEVEANPDYFDGPPYLDGIVFKVIPDGNNRVAQILSGELDFTPIDTSQVKSLQGKDNVIIRQAPQVYYDYIAFNWKQERFHDIRVRQAFAMALDKPAMLKSFLNGYGKVANGPINPLLGDYYKEIPEPYPQDLDKANSLLDEAGWKKGSDGIRVNDKGEKFTVSFLGANIFPVFKADMVYAQQQFQKIGIDVKLDIVSWTENNTKELAFQWDLLRSYWITPPEPDQYDHYFSSSKANNWAYSNKDVDDLLVKARTEPDHAKRVEMYHQLQEMLAKDLPLIYLYYEQEVQAVSTKTQNLPLIGYRDALTWMNKVWIGKA
ncbi:MAG TPA: ABC transporter substrate-binding protein [Nitrolancea sp.]|nr:ABC transporter substrate-binding protein [Nitrolancea sp.]